jgi:plasmid stabilization system protein ParE
LGDEFLDAIDDVFAKITETPETFAVVLNDVRRIKARRFPYVVYYRVRSDRIEILGVLHGRRDPKVWQRRV